MRSDNGSNFVGAIKELREAFQEMNHNQIAQYLQTHGADWITWIKSPPTASHMGGVWEMLNVVSVVQSQTPDFFCVVDREFRLSGLC